MDKINFQDGTKISSAKVTIDEVDYPVTPARYTGATPLSSLVMNTMQTNIENAIDQNVSNIGGEEYDETATYEEGDIVKYEGQLYICIEAIDTPEEWDSTKWNATDVLSSAGGNEVTIGAPEDVTGKTKIFINEEEGTDAYSEVVNSLAGDEIAKAPSVHAVNEGLDTKFNKTGGNITGNINVSNLMQGTTINSFTKTEGVSAGQSKTIDITPLYGLFNLRLAASSFEVYRMYAFMGVNRYAYKSELLLQYDFGVNASHSYTLDFVNNGDKLALKITNTGTADFYYVFSKINMN